ncbi:hypothetical protein OESDEN_08320 [Oesophagostomum dentatum]|uniref:SCP domain-containing protein n=1 Tax=Oesophagostomum dentatum TaxID=61180 RepID=A0A0B1T8U7_OESDE|nr:hypothetical protein OESDEN_08320 [Oesophagostomum dentatum]
MRTKLPDCKDCNNGEITVELREFIHRRVRHRTRPYGIVLTYKCVVEVMASKYLEDESEFTSLKEFGSVVALEYVQEGYPLDAEKITKDAAKHWRSHFGSLESKSAFGCGYRFIRARGDDVHRHKIVCVFL